MVPAAGSKIKKTDLYTARLRESDAADLSEHFHAGEMRAFPRNTRLDRRKTSQGERIDGVEVEEMDFVNS